MEERMLFDLKRGVPCAEAQFVRSVFLARERTKLEGCPVQFLLVGAKSCSQLLQRGKERKREKEES